MHTTISDEERREVARRLRAYLDTPAPWHLVDVVSDVLRDEGDYDKIQHLADLIEPGKPKVTCVAEVKVDGERLEELVHDAAVELTDIDRDALLALAEDVDEAAAMAVVMDASKGAKLLADLLLDIARRIREALGASDG